jgi:hypothetical protein
MKKLLLILVSVIATASVASAVTVTTNASYKTKVLKDGGQIFDSAIVAGTQIEAANFVLGVNTFNPMESITVGDNTTTSVSKSGLLKRVDASLGYKFTSPLADLTFGAGYTALAKSLRVNGVTNTSEVFAKLNGQVKNTLITWDAATVFNTKTRNNTIEGNLRLPIGFKWLKIAPSIGMGFNNPGAANVEAFKAAKRYVLAGVGVGYYSDNFSVAAEYFQRRDSFTSGGGVIGGVGVGFALKI